MGCEIETLEVDVEKVWILLNNIHDRHRTSDACEDIADNNSRFCLDANVWRIH